MQLQSVSPYEITVREGLERYRKDHGELKALANSIEQYGLLQPIIVTDNMELVAGGRRLAACILNGQNVTVTKKSCLTDLDLRIIELEENIQRKDFTPAEACQAVENIHNLKQAQHGKSKAGGVKEGGWSQDDTAHMLGVSRSSVTDKLAIAQMIKNYPELKTAKTLKELKKTARTFAGVTARIESLEKHKDIASKNDHLADVSCTDAFEHMKAVKSNSIDLLLTDPPYGISIDKVAMSIGGHTGENNTAGYTFNDDANQLNALYNLLANESIRFTKATSHAIVFLAPEFFSLARETFIKAGWNVAIRPVIWIKNKSGQNNAPTHWFSSCYEMILYARREKAKLIQLGKPDWLDYPPLKGEEKLHPTQKPVELLKDLIRRTTLPGSTLYDPFMGSGSSIIAGLEEKLFPIGCELMEEAFATTAMRLRRFKNV